VEKDGKVWGSMVWKGDGDMTQEMGMVISNNDEWKKQKVVSA
jgi:hypothetical protein